MAPPFFVAGSGGRGFVTRWRRSGRYQADFQLLAASASAALGLHTSISAGDPEAKRMKVMGDLMKLAHVRQRFTPEEPPRPKRDTLLFDMVCTGHENASLGALRSMFKAYTGRDLRAEYDARTGAEMKLTPEQRSMPPAMISFLPRSVDEPTEPECKAERKELREGRARLSATYVRPSEGE